MRSCARIVLVFLGSVCSAVAMGGGRLLKAAFNGSSDRILVDAADCRLVAGVAEWLFGEVLLDVRFKPDDQRSSSFRTVILRSVAELMAGMMWYMACYGELLENNLVMLANW